MFNELSHLLLLAAKKLKFSIKDFFSRCDQIHSFAWIWSHLLKKSLIENFIFCKNSSQLLAINHFCKKLHHIWHGSEYTFAVCITIAWLDMVEHNSYLAWFPIIPKNPLYCEKNVQIRTRRNSVSGQFSRSAFLLTSALL